ncbi:hypothetical protein C7974DRAFT_373393 [Boeremia exigua]|uniref:uncharacterized protein n=1 Tax=Boeremia exigua TaxID=749465 RepID=UPI001E8D487E|nr:uncharacterized protein C7974DRAFT_373393 [Boeremia exigua]KAH6639118.1 hypothetical protein C7974DRAFT_373393 [Boeremia exigua]
MGTAMRKARTKMATILAKFAHVDSKMDKDPFGDEGHVRGEDGENASPLIRLASTRTEHNRFFREAKAIWHELASLMENLHVTDIQFYLYGHSLYGSFGPEICEGGSLDNEALLQFPETLILPSLTLVKSIRVRDGTNHEIDLLNLFPAAVACGVTRSFPMLDSLDIMGVDSRRLWPLARKNLRHSDPSFANQITMLPESSRTISNITG